MTPANPEHYLLNIFVFEIKNCCLGFISDNQTVLHLDLTSLLLFLQDEKCKREPESAFCKE